MTQVTKDFETLITGYAIIQRCQIIPEAKCLILINEILILRVLLNIRLSINCPSTKNLCINKCDMLMHQTPRLISVSIHCTPILLVLSCGFSFRVFTVQYNNLFQSYYQTVTSWADAQTAQIISFVILLLFKLWQLCKNCKRHAYIIQKIPINE